MELKDFVNEKAVLMIPIFSMRSYETGIYNLSADGNMARILSFLLNANYKFATVLIPDKCSGIEEIKTILKKNNANPVYFHCTNAYGENAKQTREDVKSFLNVLMNEIDPDPYDIIITEPNMLSWELALYFPKKTIYWCVASVTDQGTPWFVKKYETIDRNIASLVPTCCAVQAQVNALKGKSFVGEFYDPTKFDFKVIFFPFRLTDENYKAKEFYEFVSKLYDSGKRNFKVLYTDLNESGIFSEVDPFEKVSSKKTNYISILKGKPIIPYFDNSEVLLHISYKEFEYYGCKIVRTFEELEKEITNEK